MIYVKDSNKPMVIQEVYYGKQKPLIEAEKVLGQFRKKYMGKIFTVKCNTDPLLIKFDDIMSEFFGFYRFAFHIYPGTKWGTAYTYNIGYLTDKLNPNADLIVLKNQYKYNPKAKYSTIVGLDENFCFNKDFTDGEIMSFILHEIGHNFSTAMSNSLHKYRLAWSYFSIFETLSYLFSGNILFLMDMLKQPMTVLTVPMPSGLWGLIIDLDKKIRREIPIAYNIIDTAKTIVQYPMNLLELLYGYYFSLFRNNPIEYVRRLLTEIVQVINPIKAIDNFFAYKDEQMADTFAAIYGYGPDLTNAMLKLNKNIFSPSKLDPSNIPVLNNICQILMLPNNIIWMAFDPHSSTIERSMRPIRLYKQNLEKQSLDPKMKKIIQKDLEDCEKAINNYTKVSGKLEKDAIDPLILKRLYAGLIIKAFGGDIRHHILTPDVNAIYDKGLERTKTSKPVSLSIKNIKFK